MHANSTLFLRSFNFWHKKWCWNVWPDLTHTYSETKKKLSYWTWEQIRPMLKMKFTSLSKFKLFLLKLTFSELFYLNFYYLGLYWAIFLSNQLSCRGSNKHEDKRRLFRGLDLKRYFQSCLLYISFSFTVSTKRNVLKRKSCFWRVWDKFFSFLSCPLSYLFSINKCSSQIFSYRALRHCNICHNNIAWQHFSLFFCL